MQISCSMPFTFDPGSLTQCMTALKVIFMTPRSHARNHMLHCIGSRLDPLMASASFGIINVWSLRISSEVSKKLVNVILQSRRHFETSYVRYRLTAANQVRPTCFETPAQRWSTVDQPLLQKIYTDMLKYRYVHSSALASIFLRTPAAYWLRAQLSG